MKAVLLCAGQGTRLGELTKNCPKAMLNLGGKPLVDYHLRYLAREGFNEIAINLHFMPDKIREYVGNGEKWGVSIHYSFEQEMLGTLGALLPLKTWLTENNNDFLVMYGDILTNQPIKPLIENHVQNQALATFFVHHRESSNSVVEFNSEGRVTRFEERPLTKPTGGHWVNSAIQILSPKVFNFIEKTFPLDIPQKLYETLYTTEKIFTVPLTGFRIAIDSKERYEEAIKNKICL